MVKQWENHWGSYTFNILTHTAHPNIFSIKYSTYIITYNYCSYSVCIIVFFSLYVFVYSVLYLTYYYFPVLACMKTLENYFATFESMPPYIIKTPG